MARVAATDAHHDQHLGLSQCYLLRKPNDRMEETHTDPRLNPNAASYRLGMLLSSLSSIYKMGRTTPNLEGPGKENRQCESSAWHRRWAGYKVAMAMIALSCVGDTWQAGLLPGQISPSNLQRLGWDTLLETWEFPSDSVSPAGGSS